MAEKISKEEMNIESVTDKKRVKYYVPDDEEESTHVTVWLNGERFVMKKGATVEVPEGVKEIYERKVAKAREIREARRAANNRANRYN